MGRRYEFWREGLEDAGDPAIELMANDPEHRSASEMSRAVVNRIRNPQPQSRAYKWLGPEDMPSEVPAAESAEEPVFDSMDELPMEPLWRKGKVRQRVDELVQTMDEFTLAARDWFKAQLKKISDQNQRKLAGDSALTEAFFDHPVELVNDVLAAVTGKPRVGPYGDPTLKIPVDDSYVPAEEPIPQERTYQVKPGDTLGTIAERELGSPGRYKEIVRMNDISDPNRIEVGTVLRLPSD